MHYVFPVLCKFITKWAVFFGGGGKSKVILELCVMLEFYRTDKKMKLNLLTFQYMPWYQNVIQKGPVIL